MKYKVFTDRNANAPKFTIVVADNKEAAWIAVEKNWEGCKVTRIEEVK